MKPHSLGWTGCQKSTGQIGVCKSLEASRASDEETGAGSSNLESPNHRAAVLAWSDFRGTPKRGVIINRSDMKQGKSLRLAHMSVA